jgi:hypothetical protein
MSLILVLKLKGFAEFSPFFLPVPPSCLGHSIHTHLPAQVLCLGPGLGAEVAVTDLFLNQMFHPVMHL